MTLVEYSESSENTLTCLSSLQQACPVSTQAFIVIGWPYVKTPSLLPRGRERLVKKGAKQCNKKMAKLTIIGFILLLLADLKEVFGQLIKYNMRLKSEKCVFRVDVGKFLGFMLNHRGIHANTDKCHAILEMRSPQNVKEAQRLADMITSLSRFVSRIPERAKPIMNLLKKAKNFV